MRFDGLVARGEIVTIALADNVVVAYLVKKNVSDIKPGDYIASTGIKGTDGKLHAIEVRIFPESLRGVGEGQYPWDLKPDSVMTNATVGTITQAPQGNVIKVSYKGAESEYTVDPTTPIFANATGDRSLLVPDAAVFMIASKHDDGKLTSTRLYVEKDGIKPPMLFRRRETPLGSLEERLRRYRHHRDREDRLPIARRRIPRQ